MDLAPHVSILVPARNEEVCISACLQSLVTQTRVNFEIIVIDDGSTDRTPAIAASFPAVRLVQADKLREGWIGKNNALVSGVRFAGGQWLLFTDADTVHRPDSLANALVEAETHNADLLSYSPEQEVPGFWEKTVMPVIFAELARQYRPSDVSDPALPAAAANGQYLLITREAYDAVGGHTAVARSLLEDVALARAVKASGRTIFFRYAGDAVRTRMYRSFSQLCEGWTKNLALLFPSPLQLAIFRFGEFALIGGGIATTIIIATRGVTLAAVIAGVLSAGLYGSFLLRLRKGNFRWDANLLSFLGLPIFSYLIIRSRSRHRRGDVRWKGRSYHPQTRYLENSSDAVIASAIRHAR